MHTHAYIYVYIRMCVRAFIFISRGRSFAQSQRSTLDAMLPSSGAGDALNKNQYLASPVSFHESPKIASLQLATCTQQSGVGSGLSTWLEEKRSEPKYLRYRIVHLNSVNIWNRLWGVLLRSCYYCYFPIIIINVTISSIVIIIVNTFLLIVINSSIVIIVIVNTFFLLLLRPLYLVSTRLAGEAPSPGGRCEGRICQ